LIERARAAKNGEAIGRLWEGDTSGYTSHSEAELALASRLAFWTGPDPERIAELVAASGLSRPKWEREDYRKRTIDKALKGKTEFFDWSKRKGRRQTRTQEALSNGETDQPHELGVGSASPHLTDTGNAARLRR